MTDAKPGPAKKPGAAKKSNQVEKPDQIEKPDQEGSSVDRLEVTLEPLGVFRVIETLANADPEVRNHLVTDAYWEMSQVLDGILHMGIKDDGRTSNANWFTVATWAVSTVGRNIRPNELPRRLDQMLPSGLRSQATPWVLSMRSRSGRRVQRALGHGQMVVFASAMVAALEFVRRSEQDALDAVADTLESLEVAYVSDLDLTLLELTRPDAVDRLRGRGQEALKNDDVQALLQPRTELTRGQREILKQIVRRSEAALRVKREESEAREEREERDGGGEPDLGEEPSGGENEIKAFLRRLDSDQPIDGMEFLRTLMAILVDSDTVALDLTEAFEAYERAKRATDPREVAQEIFRGNLIIAAVEQVLLDRSVTTVVDHVPREFEDWFELNASAWAERLVRVPRALGRLGVSRRFRRSQELVRDAWARLLTDQVLVLALPTETLRIGRDIPLRAVDGEFYPLDLACLDTPLPPTAGTVSEASQLSTDELFTLFDRSRGDGVRTGAWDWRRFDERLNFAANLLRSRQQDPSLFWRPYNDEDRSRLRRGEVPIRTGDAFEQAIAGPTFDWLESVR